MARVSVSVARDPVRRAHLIVMVEDFTKGKQAEGALRSAEKR
jgi:hypothetical protein